MNERETSGIGLAKGLVRFFGGTAAAVSGLILMIAGLGMGVTVVMLPIGLVVALLGLLLFVWGVARYPEE